MSERVLVDTEAMREMAEGCGWTIAQMVERYRHETSKEMTEITAALDGGEYAEAARRAHGLAGASETAGVPAMGPVLRRLEKAALEEQLDEARDALADATATLGDVERVLTELETR